MFDDPCILIVMQNDEVIASWVQRYTDGETIQQIADTVEPCAGTVRNHLKAAGVTFRRRGQQTGHFTTRTEKYCAFCQRTKPVEDFHLITRPSGGKFHAGYCKDCNVEHNRLWRYGITKDDLSRMLAEQGGRCAVCKRLPDPEDPPKLAKLHIDHDHQSGRTRKLLCWSCNHGLGCFEDDIERLLAAAAYVQEHREALCT